MRTAAASQDNMEASSQALRPRYSKSWSHFQELMLQEFGSQIDFVAGLTSARVAELPPFPFPEAFFPPGTSPADRR